MISRLANSAAAALGALSLSQFPEFYQQYLQRLGGRLEQALVQEARYYAAAKDAGLTIEEYIARFTTTSDEVLQNEGYIIQATLVDAHDLREALQTMTAAAPFERPFAFLSHLDQQTMNAAFDAFRPALPVTTEGLVYAGVGVLIGLMLWSGCERCGKAAIRHIKRRREERKLREFDV